MKSSIHLVTAKEEQSIERTSFSKRKIEQPVFSPTELQKIRAELRTLREELADCRHELQRQTMLLANAKIREQELRVSFYKA